MSNYMDYKAETQIEIGRKFRRLVDQDTGEVVDVQQIIKRVYNQKLFWKITLSDFLGVLGIIESKQLDVVIYVLEHTRASTNTFEGTQRKISKDTGISLTTVSKIMRKLQDLEFLKQKQWGLYYVSPRILMRGSEQKRQVLLSYFDESKSKPKKELVKRTPIIRLPNGEYELIMFPDASESEMEVIEEK